MHRGTNTLRLAETIPAATGAYQAVLDTRKFDLVNPRPFQIAVVASAVLPAAPPITSSLHLDTSRVTTGNTIQGTVTFEIHTNRPVTVQQCPLDRWIPATIDNGNASYGMHSTRSSAALGH